MPPLRSWISPTCPRALRPRTHCTGRWTSPSMPSRWDYWRFWLAEHHNMIGIASAATAVVIGFIAGGTRPSGSVRAESCCQPRATGDCRAVRHTEVAVSRADRSGLGRAPGTDHTHVAGAAARSGVGRQFSPGCAGAAGVAGAVAPGAGGAGRAGHGAGVPIWILGSSLFGAQLAGVLGLPYAFASHFAPDALMRALAMYRAEFKPSRQLARPHTMVGVNVIAAETDAEARRLFTSHSRASPICSGVRGAAAAADRRYRHLLDARREGAGLGHAGLLVRRVAGDGESGAGGVDRTHRRGRIDGGVRHLRSRCAAAVLRDPGGTAAGGTDR